MVKLKNTYSEAPIQHIFAAIDETLGSHGATRISKDFQGGRATALVFSVMIGTRLHSFRLPARMENVEKLLYPGREELTQAMRNQAYRTAWANVRDWVAAQMALVQTGMAAMEEIFLPYMLDEQSGQTFFEVWREHQRLLPSPVDATIDATGRRR